MLYKILIPLLVLGHLSVAQNLNDRILVKGQVFSKEDNAPMAYVNVYPIRSDYGTFTNHDGAFELLVRKADRDKKLVIHMVGFKEQTIPIDTDRSYQIFLEARKKNNPDAAAMMSAETVMDRFRENVRNNYSSNPMVNRVFLREYEKIRDEENLYLNEVVVDYLRYGYFDGEDDIMKLIKGRNKIYDQSIGFSYTSGGFKDIHSDVIKYPKDYLISSKGYEYKLEDVIPSENGQILKIRFDPKSKNEYQGYLYIEDQNFALIKSEVEYSEAGRELINRISKKSGFYWDNLKETVVYKLDSEGKYNLSEIVNEGIGYDHHLQEQMIATTEILVISTNRTTFFANEFYDVKEGISLFELDFEASQYFWDDNNYIVMENSFKEGYVD